MPNLDAAAANLEQAASDPCFAIRNLAGHFTTCNYGDWHDFTKCHCAESLLSAPEQSEAFQVVPMPLRDFFAASVNIPLEQAAELALLLKGGAEAIAAGDLDLSKTIAATLTMAEVAEAKARLRYLEADAMCERRKVKRGQDETSNAE